MWHFEGPDSIRVNGWFCFFALHSRILHGVPQGIPSGSSQEQDIHDHILLIIGRQSHQHDNRYVVSVGAHSQKDRDQFLGTA